MIPAGSVQLGGMEFAPCHEKPAVQPPPMSSLLRSVHLLAGLACLAFRLGLGAAPVRFESVTLDEGGPAAKVGLQWCLGTAVRHPVILMLGALDSNAPPAWSTNLVQEGWMLCAFSVAHPPDPDPARRPQWLVFDERFAHSYPLAAQRAIADSQRVVAYLRTRADVDPDKLVAEAARQTQINAAPHASVVGAAV